MSEDEIFVFLACLVIAFAYWTTWYARRARIRAPRGAAGRAAVFAAPVLALALVAFVLRTWAAHDVRDSGIYIGFYLAMGAAWLGLVALVLPLLGLHTRDDVFERGNRAAAYAVAGSLVGGGLAFAGGNVGDGPGWWVVVFSALLATGGLLAAWWALDRTSGVAEAVTVDRDPAAGMRVAGFFVAAGVVLGRAAAGDWVSAGATLRDFVALGWPVLLLVVAAAFVERSARPTPERPAAEAWQGLPAALGYVFAALLYLRLVPL